MMLNLSVKHFRTVAAFFTVTVFTTVLVILGPACLEVGAPADDERRVGPDATADPQVTPTPIGPDYSAYSYVTEEYGCDPNTHVSSLYAGAGRGIAWGDLHAHSTYSQDAEKQNSCLVTPQNAITYARDTADLNFVAITDHAENGEPGGYTQDKWNLMIAQEQTFPDPAGIILTPVFDPNHSLFTAKIPSGGIVVFPAFEYTRTPTKQEVLNNVYPKGNGHKNIICYDYSHLPTRGVGWDYCTDPNDPNTMLSDPSKLWTYLDGFSTLRDPNTGKWWYITIPHHPAKTQDMEYKQINVSTDWSEAYLSANVMPLVEVYSSHGSSEMAMDPNTDDQIEQVKGFDSNKSVESVLHLWLEPGIGKTKYNSAYKFGFVGGTDTHDGDPGNVVEDPNNLDSRLGYFTGGLTAVWVPKRDRENIWVNLTAKNCYATSGARIGLEFTAKLGDALAPMGGTLTHAVIISEDHPALVNLHVYAVGQNEAKITRIQILRDGSCVWDTKNSSTFTAANAVHLDRQDTLKANYAYYRVKVWQDKPAADYPSQSSMTNNIGYERAWSSPIWIEKTH